ncbi:MAG: hypothetical protein IJQ43_02270, partial [Oscillospiraceae bacterium]|nr:hypothetical protein [Oscillospiraceae bacterium]
HQHPHQADDGRRAGLCADLYAERSALIFFIGLTFERLSVKESRFFCFRVLFCSASCFIGKTYI